MTNVHAPQHTYPSAASRAEDAVTLSPRAHEAYGLLHWAFVIASVAAGLDKLSLEHDKLALAARGLPAEGGLAH